MSRTSRRLRIARRGEAGFTLTEVMAAMVVFAIVATAVTAMFASGLRASLLTKMDTTAKNLSQQKFESIRNLPYHIDQVSGSANPPDLLDTYYKNTTTVAGGRGQTGYVPAGSQRWTADGDPATGAFYRYVEATIPDFPKFKQYVATQFLDVAGNPFNPTSFDSQAVGFDAPPTLVVGMSVTTLWKAGKLNRVSRVYSQVSDGQPSKPMAVLQSRLTALRMTGGLSGARTLSVELASLSGDGGLSRTVTAAQAVKAATMCISTGACVNGAVSSVKAPPNSGTVGTGAGPKQFLDGTMVRAEVGTTKTSGVLASSSTGQVVLSSATTPALAEVLGGGVGVKTATLSVDSNLDSRFQVLGTHAYLEDAGCGTSCGNAGASGWASTTSTSTTKTTQTSASAYVRGAVVFMPTSFAPLGLVRVKLTNATVTCKVTRSGTSTPVPTASVSYQGTLSYWAPFHPSAVGGYVTLPLASTDTTSPLTPTILSNTQVGTDTNGSPLWLSDYVATWSSSNAATLAAATDVGVDSTTISTSFSGLISITSTQLRTGDPTSTVGVEIATGGCTAEEYR